VADGTPATLRKQAQGKALLRVSIEDATSEGVLNAFNAHALFHSIEHIGGKQFELETSDANQGAREVFRTCVGNRWTLVELNPIEVQLEEIFRDLTIN